MQAQLGAQQQNQQQQMINQQIQNFANAQQYPLMQLGFMSNMLRGLPMQSTNTNQYVATPNPISQGIGTLGAAYNVDKAIGGKAEGGESKAEHKAEMRKMDKIEKELKHHEHEKASKAHRGLKKGGNVIHAVPGGLLPGVTKAHGKGVTGGVRKPGYKKGGNIQAYANTKMHDDAKGNAVKKSTSGGIEGPGYKKGGHADKKHHYAKGGSVAAYVNTKMHDDASEIGRAHV